MIKFVAVDIDGTLTFRNRRLDIAGVSAVQKAEDSGLPVVLATGNVLAFAEAAAIMLGTSGPLIAEDGGIVFDPASGWECVLGDRVDAERGLAVLERELGPLQQTRSSRVRITGIALKRTIEAGAAEELFRREGLNLVAVDLGLTIHLRSPNVNKGNALRKIASFLRVPLAEVATIGNGLNDVEMLEVAGLSFAVANSDEAVKRVSTYVTTEPHGKGVAEAIEKILSLRD
ncbi:Phosphatase YwpJ [subsurface metagenome]|nr:phosphoglycolate phosphatase [Hadesarchaea archaeon]